MADQAHKTTDSTGEPLLSEVLQRWLNGKQSKTLADLSEAFGEKSFAIIFLVLMILAALPLPTGGVTHVTELITMLISLELVAGRRTVWLPRRWLKLEAGKLLAGKGGQRLIAVIKWFERLSRRRWSSLLVRRGVVSVTGLLVFILTLAAFVAPPFSGLDTLPALGVVIISLAIILEDALIAVIGVTVGAAGIGLEVAAGAAIYNGLNSLF